MSIIHRYLFSTLLRHFSLSLCGITFLFVVVDFFDRIDNILTAKTKFLTGLSYFLFKIPFFLHLSVPIAILLATMVTFAGISKNSEVIAMRASGLKISYISKPVIVIGFIASLLSIIIGETILPYSQRRVKEIYNIDIRKKNETGTYSQDNFWWRSGDSFFSSDLFDSRTDSFYGFSTFDMGSDFTVLRRVDAAQVNWVTPSLGWTMKGVTEYSFQSAKGIGTEKRSALPLPIKERPKEFYDVETDPATMSYLALSNFILKQRSNGISVAKYFADLYAKLAFPFVCIISPLIVVPFALKDPRKGGIALSFVAATIVGFSYYAVHSLSISLGRAEIWPALLAAWMANIVMGSIALILNLGAESPG